jgi:uncharacterized protein with PIN domain
MSEALVRCYAELNDMLPEWRRYRETTVSWEGDAKVVELITLLKIPVSNVDLILLNGESVSLDDPVRAGDRLALYPVFESFDIGGTQRVRPDPLRAPRFILDVHLGKLAAHLRMLGFDSVYGNATKDEDLVRGSLEEERVLLSRDRELTAHPRLTRAFLVHAQDPEEQLLEVVRRFQLRALFRPFTRCLRCNSMLIRVSKDEVLEQIPPRVRETQTEFHRCPSCARIYWPGSHQQRMNGLVQRILGKEID